MQQDLLEKFTELGDPMLLLLGGLGVFFYLWCADERRSLARGWAVAFGLCVFLTVTSKFAFYSFGGNQPDSFRLHSPSGHVAIGTGFYGCCAMMLAAGRSQAGRLLIWSGTAMLLGGLAASRIMLGLHTIPEIAIAFAIGAFCLVVFGTYLGNKQPAMLNASQMIALLVLIDVAHYSHVDGEPLIRRLMQKIDHLHGEQANGIVESSHPAAQLGLQSEQALPRH
jgi:membrane-associated phospholipid phosphatase